MKISTKGRYALRLMIDLAQHDAGGYIPLRDISKRQQISAKYLEQIVVQLSRAGFVISTRGAQGGYQLARHPSEYTVGDILRITEGSLAPVACLEHEPVDCPRVDECITLSFWRGLYDAINNYPRKVLNWSISNTVFGKFTIATQPFHFSMGFAVSPVFLQLRKGERQSGYSCVCFVKYSQFTDTVLLHIAAALRNSFVW